MNTDSPQPIETPIYNPTPPGPNNRIWMIVAAVVIVLLLGAVVYFMLGAAKSPIPSATPTIGSADSFVPVATKFPDSDGGTPTPSPDIQSGQVNFQPRQTLGDLELIPSGPNSQASSSYFKLGSFTSGKYKGYDFVLARTQFDGPGTPSSFRFAVKGSTAVMLLQNSDPYWRSEEVTPSFAMDNTYAVAELMYPNAFRSSDGKATFLLDRYTRDEWSSFIGARELAKVGTLKGYGDIFTDPEPTGSTSTGIMFNLRPNQYGYYLHALDGSVRVYYMTIPFVQGNNLGEGIMRITWSDGKVNADDYSWVNVGGCGMTSYAAVISSELVRAQDLVQAGTSSNGDAIYVFADTGHSFLRNIYDKEYPGEYIPGQTQATLKKIPYADFVSQKPVFFWRDPMGRLIRFLSVRFLPQTECGKPVIYLYPTFEQEVSVKVSPRGGMTVSDPAYGQGWNVKAKPSGELTDLASGLAYPYLFWEGRGGIYEQPQKGWSVARDDVSGFLSEKLTAFGLNDKEIADFKEFWLPRMRTAPYYFVTFLGTAQMDDLAPLQIDPKPDTVIRVLMDFSPLQKPAQVRGFGISAPARKGFTVIEWGGVLK